MTELRSNIRGVADTSVVHLQRRSGDRALQEVFARSGEIGRLVCDFDWKTTPPGPMEDWPQSLKIAVSMTLTSRFAMYVGWGRELTFIYNDAYGAMTLGTKHPSALGRPLRDVWSEIWGDIGPRFESVFNTGQATWDEELMLTLERNGFPEETYHTFSYSPIPDEGGGVGGILCAVREDTQRVISQRRLKALRELATHTSEEIGSAERACEAAAKILVANRFDVPFALIYLLDEQGKRASLAGAMGLEEGVAAAPRSIDLEVSEPGATWPLKDALRTRHPQVVVDLEESFGPLPSGVWPVSVQTAVVQPLITSDQDRLCGWLVAGISPRLRLDDDYRDFLHLLAGRVAIAITNARAYEAERKRAEALAEIDRVKTNFFSNISHEFRTPLTLMLGPMEELLAHGEPIPVDARHQLEMVQRNSQRLLKLVNTLLDFSRIEAGRVQASYEPVDLAALTRDLASSFRSAVQKAGLHFIVDCFPLDEPVYVDREMWEKIVLNLLSNAFKFTFEGSIEVALRSAEGVITLQVKDTGVGIPEEELSKVFDRFHRVNAARARTHEGSGIGLTLVQELAKLHGGSVQVTSMLGMGTTFTVTLPKGSAHLPQERVGAPREADAPIVAPGSFLEEVLGWLPADTGAERIAAMRAPDSAGSPAREPAAERVLVADDNADMRGYLRRLLEPHWVVETVEDGSKLLAAALTQPPDLILADVMMPGLDGFQLLRELRADTRTATVPVILLSARAGEEAKVEGMNAGADDYVVKPFSARELLARVAARLEIARVRYDSEQRISSILEGMTDGFIAVDRDWRITYVNAAAERDNAVTRENLLGKTQWEAFPAVLGTEFERTLKHAMAERVPSHGENFYEPHGRWYEMHVHPIKDGGLAFYGRDITERKHAEQALRESEERMRLATEGAQVFAWDVDLASEAIQYSADIGPIFGYETLPEEYRDLRKSLNLVHPDDRERTRECTKRALREITLLKSEYRVKAAGGRYIWLESHGIVIRGLQGTPQRLLGVAQNISERKEAECAFQQVQRERDEVLKRLKLQFERMPVACVVSDPSFRVIDWNPAAENLFGYRRDEIVGKDCHVLVPPHVLSELQIVEQRLVAGDMRAHTVNENLTKDGRILLCEWYNTPLLDADGNVIAIFAMAQDITERKRAEQALRESEERFRAMADSSPIMIWVTDAEGSVEFLNRTYLEFFGVTPEQANKFDWRAVLHADDREAYVSAFATAIRERQPLYARTRVRRRDGEWRWIESRGNPRVDAQGRVTGYVGSSPDITDIYETQEALRTADRRKDEFLATLGHELRNPLAAISYSLNALRLNGGIAPGVQRAHELMERKADHLVRLVDDLLEVSRITRGAIELRKERVDLASVIHDAIETSRSLVEAAGHQLNVALPAEPLLLDADPLRLAQVVANLLHNAAKYTEGRGQIWLTARREDGHAIISVRDTGIGIPVDMLPRVFDMFMQVHRSLMRGARGLGIGLTLVRELVNLHGGTVEARSEGPGKGAELIVRLPLPR